MAKTTSYATHPILVEDVSRGKEESSAQPGYSGRWIRAVVISGMATVILVILIGEVRLQRLT